MCLAAQKVIENRALAEEIAQEAYLKLSELKLEVKHPLAYCYQIVRNLAIDRKRRHRMECLLFVAEEQGHDVATGAGTPEQIAIARQQLTLVMQLLDRLPERVRQAYVLHRLDGLTQRDIGKLLGVSAALVNFMISEAAKLLQNHRALRVID